jgi:SsrA-binding protein
MKGTEKVLSVNRKAHHLYSIVDKLEAGIVLTGEEVKSIRNGRIAIDTAYIGERKGQLYLMDASIAKYDKATTTEHEEKRHRKLLLHKKQINKIIGSIKAPGYSAVVLKVYTNPGNKIKLEIAVVRGKSQIDKRASIKEREWRVEKGRLLKLGSSTKSRS